MIVTNLECIQKIINEGNGIVLSEKYCTDFDDYLCNHYPWVPITASKIDWEKVPGSYKRFNWVNISDKETEGFLRGTCIDEFDEVCIVYGARQPGLLVSREFAYKNFPVLTIFGWTVRFVVGVRRDQHGLIVLKHNCFVEVDFIDWLTSSC